ncbi:MAG: hypothetical protein OXH75_04435 [Acidobacteria bacterium]|nr:hypothetical protein [Acidobacteriota bacterium]
MATVRADSKRRVVVPGARPGDVFDIQRQDDHRYLFVRLQRPAAAPKMTREECLEAISRYPLPVGMSWEQLRKLTREP